MRSRILLQLLFLSWLFPSAFCCTSLAQGLNTDNARTNNNRFKGAIPWTDVSVFTRPNPVGNSSGFSATVNVTGTLATFTGGSYTSFQNGDGITIYGAGATLAISTPSLTNVTPSLSSGGTGLGGGPYSSLTSVSGNIGSSTYDYKLIARDRVGGYTAPSSATQITNGASKLGIFSCPVSTASRSAFLITVNFSSTCPGAVVGAMMQLSGLTSSKNNFDGFYNIKTVNASTQVIVSGPYHSAGFGWQAADYGANSATGGTAYFIASNHLSWSYASGVWEYYVCAKRPGDSFYHLIGTTQPSTSVYEDVQFDDYGSPANDSQVYPSYIEINSDTPNSKDAICNSRLAQNDPLTTTISSGGGTSRVTLANGATNPVSEATAWFDDAPGILSAANSVSGSTLGTLVVPPSANPFVINSYLKLPSHIVINQMGTLAINETLELPGSISWRGMDVNHGISQFGYVSNGGAVVNTHASPSIYISGAGVSIDHVNPTVTGNVFGGTQVLDEGGNGILDYMQFSAGGGSNVNMLGIPLIVRNLGGASNPSNIIIDHSEFVASNVTSPPTDEMWGPFIYLSPVQSGGSLATGPSAFVTIRNTSGFQRTFVMENANNGCVTLTLDNVTRQSGVSPKLWIEGSGTCNVSESSTVQDTDGSAMIALGNNTGTPGRLNVEEFLQPRVGYTVSNPPLTGFSPQHITTFYGQLGVGAPNAVGTGAACATGNNNLTGAPYLTNCNFDQNSYIGPNASILFPLSAPKGLSASLGAGGSLPSGRFQFQISAIGADGNETIPTPISSPVMTSGTCPGSGNCEVQLRWSPVNGAAGGYRLYACGPNFNPCGSGTGQVSGAITGTSITVTSSAGAGNLSPLPFTQSGTVELNSSGAIHPQAQLTPRVFSSLPSCVSSRQGLIATVTDSMTTTWGATITGGGTNTVLAFCDKINWTVAGK